MSNENGDWTENRKYVLDFMKRVESRLESIEGTVNEISRTTAYERGKLWGVTAVISVLVSGLVNAVVSRFR